MKENWIVSKIKGVSRKSQRYIEKWRMKRFLIKNCWFTEEELAKLTHQELIGLYSYWAHFSEMRRKAENFPEERKERAIIIIARNENNIFIFFNKLIASRQRETQKNAVRVA